MTQRTSPSRRGRGPDRPLIVGELESLREKPPRSGPTVPLSQLERLAILNGIRDGDAPSRIAAQWKVSATTVERVRTRLYDEPVASTLEGDTKYKARYPGISYEGPLWKFVDFQVRDALRRKLSVAEACNRWGSGANLFETVPSVLFIVATYGHSTEEAMVRAVNDAKDNDTTATIVGAAVGALHGSQSIPKPWLDKLTGRTGKHNDGEVFKRILHAKHQFWLGS